MSLDKHIEALLNADLVQCKHNLDKMTPETVSRDLFVRVFRHSYAAAEDAAHARGKCCGNTPEWEDVCNDYKTREISKELILHDVARFFVSPDWTEQDLMDFYDAGKLPWSAANMLYQLLFLDKEISSGNKLAFRTGLQITPPEKMDAFIANALKAHPSYIFDVPSPTVEQICSINMTFDMQNPADAKLAARCPKDLTPEQFASVPAHLKKMFV